MSCMEFGMEFCVRILSSASGVAEREAERPSTKAQIRIVELAEARALRGQLGNYYHAVSGQDHVQHVDLLRHALSIMHYAVLGHLSLDHAVIPVAITGGPDGLGLNSYRLAHRIPADLPFEVAPNCTRVAIAPDTTAQLVHQLRGDARYREFVDVLIADSLSKADDCLVTRPPYWGFGPS